ncbi:hypothetical protein ATANTOWER_024846 [Ataeniobius toweri]|uniref:Uncharacterized protein n=1 Tax=Ataeniobius toweri TaxID=208326 RepID=A0ABU7A897_9TELE|nr:hypothetical protein [Ataeniobius toweri]
MIKIIYVLRTLFPNYCFRLDSDQAGSLLVPPSPGPRHKRTLSTLQRKYLHNELTQISPSSPKPHLSNHLNKLCCDNLDPESLYPWRPDRTNLMLVLSISSASVISLLGLYACTKITSLARSLKFI